MSITHEELLAQFGITEKYWEYDKGNQWMSHPDGTIELVYEKPLQESHPTLVSRLEKHGFTVVNSSVNRRGFLDRSVKMRCI